MTPHIRTALQSLFENPESLVWAGVVGMRDGEYAVHAFRANTPPGMKRVQRDVGGVRAVVHESAVQSLQWLQGNISLYEGCLSYPGADEPLFGTPVASTMPLHIAACFAENGLADEVLRRARQVIPQALTSEGSVAISAVRARALVDFTQANDRLPSQPEWSEFLNGPGRHYLGMITGQQPIEQNSLALAAMARLPFRNGERIREISLANWATQATRQVQERAAQVVAVAAPAPLVVAPPPRRIATEADLDPMAVSMCPRPRYVDGSTGIKEWGSLYREMAR